MARWEGHLTLLILFAAACVSTAAFGGVSLFANRRAQREIGELKLVAASHSKTALELNELRSDLSALFARFEALDDSRREQAEWAAEAESLNLNRRGQVLRLHRRGESAIDIAKSLKLGQGEVALIIKVHEMGRADFDQR